MSHPGYPNALPVSAVIARLAEACATAVHEFWPDDVSLLDKRVADPTRIHGPRQLTDIYLLSLAIQHGGKLIAFDAKLSLDGVRRAENRHLLVL